MKTKNQVNILLIIGLVTLTVAISPASAATILVQNPSFENGLGSWSQTGDFGAEATSTSQYANGVPDGNQYAFSNNIGTISQVLAETLQPDTTYILTVGVGYRKDLPGLGYSFPGYGVELWAGGVKLASDYDAAHGGTGAATPAADQWKNAVITYTSGASVTPGQTLEIRLRGYAIQTNYDKVLLDGSPAVPEPSVATLLGLGACALLRRTRSGLWPSPPVRKRLVEGRADIPESQHSFEGAEPNNRVSCSLQTRLQHMKQKNSASNAAWTTPRLCSPLFVLMVIATFVGPAKGTGLTPITTPVVYSDGRPYPSYRMNATDLGKFLEYGGAPNQTDSLGIREALINQVDGKFYLYYDGAGLNGWRAHLAESTDLKNWELKGPILDLGAAGSLDAAAACSPWIMKDDANLWHMFYLATPNATPAPDYIPGFPYLTLRATASSPAGPWTKQYAPRPFNLSPGTYYSEVAAPGHVLKQGNEYLMFFSSTDSRIKRTIGIARTTDLSAAWTVDAAPALPVEEQIENSSLYFEPANNTWFLFTNHIGNLGGEFTDGIWVYWTQNLNTWNPANKAVVLDGSNCSWSSRCIGMPSVTVVGDKLYIFYDAPGGADAGHMRRSLGMATLQLPLDPTVPPDEIPPTIQSLSPAQGQIDAAPSTNLVLIFDEPVQKGAGSIVIKKHAEGTVVETIPISGNTVIVSNAEVTINPAGVLAAETRYNVEIQSGAIKDLSGNPFNGFSADAAWSFTTRNGTQITVANHSFENGLGSWSQTGDFGTEATSTTQYTNGVPDGNQYAFSNNIGTISQVLAETLQPDTTYTLTVGVGYRKDLPLFTPPYPFPGYGVELWAGGVKLASDYDTGHGGTGAATPAADQWKNAVITYTSGASVTPGQALQIRLRGYAIQTNYDKVLFNAATVVGSNFNSWIQNYDIGGQISLADDPDGDGIPSGVENFFGTDPGAFSHGMMPGAVDTGARTFTFTHPQGTLAADLAAAYLWSKDLSAFYADGATSEDGTTVNLLVQPGMPSAGNTTVTATARGTAAKKLFVKVKVTQN